MKYVKETQNQKSFMKPLTQRKWDHGSKGGEVKMELAGTWMGHERHLLTNWTQEHLKEVGMTPKLRKKNRKRSKLGRNDNELGAINTKSGLICRKKIKLGGWLKYISGIQDIFIQGGGEMET